MIWFEWKKIFERRLNMAAMLLGYLLIGACVFCFIAKENIYDGFYLWFVIVICVSPVFSSEYESGAAALLLTTKHGKVKACGGAFVYGRVFGGRNIGRCGGSRSVFGIFGRGFAGSVVEFGHSV